MVNWTRGDTCSNHWSRPHRIMSFFKELLAIVASFKEWRNYLGGNSNRSSVMNSLYQSPESRELHHNKEIDPKKNSVGRNPRIIWLGNWILTRETVHQAWSPVTMTRPCPLKGRKAPLFPTTPTGQHHIGNFWRDVGVQNLVWGQNSPPWQCQALFQIQYLWQIRHW